MKNQSTTAPDQKVYFDDLPLNDQLLDGLYAMGFEEATPIQAEAIPVILDGRDLIACAQTGTGKTAAFLLPLLHMISELNQSETAALIIVPTRELAMQIDEQLEAFAYFTGLSSIAVYGGQGKEAFNAEKKALSSGADIIVATPGRLIAHLNLGYVKFGDIKYFIMDEADRMFDMGFIKAITHITEHLPRRRQTLLFSATMPHKVRQFAKRSLHNPASINIAVSKPSDGINQNIYKVDDEQKSRLLQHIIKERKDEEGLTLVFCSRKTSVKSTTAELKSKGISAGQIHSDLPQDMRKEMLRKYQNKQLKVLVATDILSRGIDVDGITLVINYDMPSDPEDYIHRIGRTARAAAKGTAITFVNRADSRKLKRTEQLMERKVPVLELPEFLRPKSRRHSRPKANGSTNGSKRKTTEKNSTSNTQKDGKPKSMRSKRRHSSSNGTSRKAK